MLDIEIIGTADCWARYKIIRVVGVSKSKEYWTGKEWTSDDKKALLYANLKLVDQDMKMLKGNPDAGNQA